jgi:hypothetical protein
MHVMQSENLKKLQKIVLNISRKYRKSFANMFQREELGGLKGDQYEGFI